MGEEIEVLIVEDDIRIADIHRRFTEKIEGFKVIGTATTGEQAKEWLELVKPQLVLLDVYLICKERNLSHILGIICTIQILL